MTNEELVKQIQSGSTERIQELWSQVTGLVAWKARHIMVTLGLYDRSCGVEMDDLMQSGFLAMMDAVRTYDPAGGSFSNWLMYHIKNAFAEATGFDTKKRLYDPINNSISLDMFISDDSDGGTLKDVLADPVGQKWQEGIEESVWKKQLQDAMHAALEAIPEGDAEVLKLRYWKEMTLDQIGKIRGSSRDRIYQIEQKAIRKLKKPDVACNLIPFWDFDFYLGSGLSAFKSKQMSIQERYVLAKEVQQSRMRRQQRKQAAMRHRQKYCKSLSEIMEEASAKVAKMTPEEKTEMLARRLGQQS